MKKLLSTISVFSLLFMCGQAFAETGYVDYAYISKNYPLAQKYSATLKTKMQNIKKYAEQKDIEANKAKTRAEKMEIRKKGIEEVKAKQAEFKTLKNKYEAELDLNVQKAADTVRKTKNLDVIVKKDAVVSGGVDCTIDVLNILKSVK